MNYSKITSVEVTNFMVYKHAKISFDDSNIINMKGYNSSGKSTMLKAVGVCLMNLFPKGQAKLIRHGEDYFRIVVSFDDGVSIVRDKYMNGQSLYEVYKNDKRIFTTKEGSRLTKVEAVPEVIQNYLGLCMLSTGCLNYQSRQDRLWLIETSGSENYAGLNEVLKTEEISRATAMINSDRNKLGGDIAGIEADIQAVELELENARGYSERLLGVMQSRQEFVEGLQGKMTKLERMTSILEQLEGVKTYPEVEKLEIGNFTLLERLEKLSESISEIEVRPAVSVLDSTDLRRLETLESLENKAKDAIRFAKLGIMPHVKEIETADLTTLNAFLPLLKKMNTVIGGINKIDEALSKTNKVLEGEVKKASKAGIQFVKCDNCGSYMEVSGL